MGVNNLLHDHVGLPHVLDLTVQLVILILGLFYYHYFFTRAHLILVSAQVLWVLTLDLDFGQGLDKIEKFNE